MMIYLAGVEMMDREDPGLPAGDGRHNLAG